MLGTATLERDLGFYVIFCIFIPISYIFGSIVRMKKKRRILRRRSQKR